MENKRGRPKTQDEVTSGAEENARNKWYPKCKPENPNNGKRGRNKGRDEWPTNGKGERNKERNMGSKYEWPTNKGREKKMENPRMLPEQTKEYRAWTQVKRHLRPYHTIRSRVQPPTNEEKSRRSLPSGGRRKSTSNLCRGRRGLNIGRKAPNHIRKGGRPAAQLEWIWLNQRRLLAKRI